MISPKLNIQYAMECSYCENRIDVVAPINGSTEAIKKLRKKIDDSGWLELSLGKNPIGCVCPNCADDVAPAAEDTTDEEDDNEQTATDDEANEAEPKSLPAFAAAG